MDAQLFCGGSASVMMVQLRALPSFVLFLDPHVQACKRRELYIQALEEVQDNKNIKDAIEEGKKNYPLRKGSMAVGSSIKQDLLCSQAMCIERRVRTRSQEGRGADACGEAKGGVHESGDEKLIQDVSQSRQTYEGVFHAHGRPHDLFEPLL